MSINDYRAVPPEEQHTILKKINRMTNTTILRLDPALIGTAAPLGCRITIPKSNRKKVGTFYTEEELVKWAKQEWKEIDNGTIVPGRVTLQALVNGFLAMKRQTCKAKEVEAYELLFERLKDRGVIDVLAVNIHKQTLEALEDISDAVEWSAGSWNAAIVRMRSIGEFATTVASGANLPRNPWKELPERTEADYMPDVYSVAEQRAIVRGGMNTEVGRLIILLFLTGTRFNEARWLRWSHFRWHEGYVQIRIPTKADETKADELGIKRGARDRDDRWKSIKTVEERDVPMEPDLITLFKPLSQAGDGYVFTDRMLKSQSKQVAERFEKLCEQVGVRVHRKSIHVIRHTYACTLFGAGVPVEDGQGIIGLSTRLGHSMKANTTREVYLKARHLLTADTKDWPKCLVLLSDTPAQLTFSGKLEKSSRWIVGDGKGSEAALARTITPMAVVVAKPVASQADTLSYDDSGIAAPTRYNPSQRGMKGHEGVSHPDYAGSIPAVRFECNWSEPIVIEGLEESA